MSLNDFEIIKRLGEGAYSSVYHVKRIADGDFYALKKVRMQKLSDKEKENALNEVRILASIRHPNIVAYKEAFIDEASQSLCIVMEYADSGDLFQQICEHQKNNTLFKEDDIWKMFIQMVRGLRCLHEIMIFHRDLKSANVFLNKDGTAKLGDMNVSKVAKKGMLYTQTGTPYYASPEVWRDQPYDNKSDIWSLGCVLYESVTLKPPFRADDMQGLYKKVLRGVYPKIPTVYSSDLANMIKSLVQVTPQMRPSCERILELPYVRKKAEKLFPQDEFYDSQSSLLNTIRVPKNLLYLTDRLPKPSYESPQQYRKKLEEEERRRKTHDAGNMLPEIKQQQPIPKKPKNIINSSVDNAIPSVNMSQQTQIPGGQQQQQKETAGKKSRKSNGGVPGKQVRVRSDLKGGPEDGSPEAYANDEISVKIGTAASQGKGGIADEDRGSVVSKGSVGNQKQVPSVLPSQRDGAAQQQQQQQLIRKNTNKRQAPVAPQSHRAPKEPVQHYSVDRDADDYDNDQFERDDLQQQQHSSYSPPPKIIHAPEDKDSVHESSHYQQSVINSNISPAAKRSQISKIQPLAQHQNMSGGQQQQLQHPVPQLNSLQQPRPQVNYSVNRIAPSEASNAGSVERIYIPKGTNNQSSLPSLAENHHSQSRKNLAYINITGEGAKPVGYLGLKKAEKDLIMRRYKYNHHVSDHIQRVALIYGNPHAASGAGNSHSQHAPSYQLNYLNQGQNNGGAQGLSPYLQSQLNSIQTNQNNNLAGIIKRNKYAPSQIIEENVSGVQKLPKIGSSVGRHLEHNQPSAQLLPPIGAGQIGSLNGHSILSKNQQQLQQQLLLQQQQSLLAGVGGVGYQPPSYVMKGASKIKSIPRPILVPSQGVAASNERGAVSLNKYSVIQQDSTGSVSRSHQLQSVNQSNLSNANDQQQQQQLGNQPSQKELRKIYQRKSRPAPEGSASRVARNGARSGIGAHNDLGGSTSVVENNNNANANDDEYE